MLSAACERYHHPQEALEALEMALLQSVRRQALADVPLGCFLSGGIDSSLITSLLQRISPRPVRSFTIAFPACNGSDAGFDEAPHARAVASCLGTDHCEVALTSDDARAMIPQLPRLYSEPFADSSQIPTHLVCREARRSGLTVALSGDGGDELFGGYRRHRIAPQLVRRLGFLPGWWRQIAACGLAQLPVTARGLAQHRRSKLAAAIRAADSLEGTMAALIRVWPDPSLLLTPLWKPAQTDADGRSPGSALPQAPTAAERLMLADLLCYLPADLLVKVDRAAMAVGLETRAPFLDPAVAAVAWRMPLAMKIRPAGAGSGAVGKWALRQLLARDLPAELIERPKAGFAMPIGAWLRGPLRGWAEDLLQPSLLRRQGILRPEPIESLWRQHLSGRADHSPRLWSVLMWQAWLMEWRRA